MPARTPVASLKRKNIVLDQKKIDRVKRIFGAATETEAIDRALDEAADLAAFRRELDLGFKELLGRGGFKDRFTSGGQ